MSKTTGEKPSKLDSETYETELYKLQVELCKLQEWVKHTGTRIIVVFEGQDGAGKGGMIRRITARVSPRVFRVVALPVPNETEKSQIYLQRYVQHFPALRSSLKSLRRATKGSTVLWRSAVERWR